MNRTLVAVVVVLLATSACATGPGGGSGVGAPSPTTSSIATSSPSPSASPATAALPAGTIPPGTYVIGDRCCVGAKRLYLTMPAGWESFDPVFAFKHPDQDAGGFGLTVEAWLVGNVYVDPCHRAALNPPVGPTVDDLVSALVKEAGPNASAVTDTTLGGYPAKRIVLTVPADVDLATCKEKSYSWWNHRDEPTGWGPRIFGQARVDTVYVLDVDGTRQVVTAGHVPSSTAADRAEQDQIVASIRFEP